MAEPLDYPRTVFTESQRPSGRMLAVALIPAFVLASVGIGFLVFGRAAPAFLLPAVLTGGVLVGALVMGQGLITVVTSHELMIRYWPLRWKRIPLHEIVEARVDDYHPIREFGGWGIKWSLLDSTTGYTISGTRGVRIRTAGNRKLLIGSKRPEALLAAIEQGRSGQTTSANSDPVK